MKDMTDDTLDNDGEVLPDEDAELVEEGGGSDVAEADGGPPP